jgi:gliding motility-associated-like protein
MFNIKFVLSSVAILMTFTFSFSQLSFCPGNTGDPIFEEDFGQGTTNGPPLPASVTSYTYVNQGPFDGEYTISENIQQLSTFHNTGDHTGNQNGKALIVNASFDAGLFYQIPIQGLCENNSYEFSAFLMNVYDSSTNACPGNGIPVNVRFQIWDESDTTLLAEGDTGVINGSATPQWQQFALTFATLDNQTAVILKMLNNGEGGCGNDLAIDDIVFRSCGDLTDVESPNDEESITLCGDDTAENPVTITAQPDFSVYDTHFYQWQESLNGEDWSNIDGETDETLTIDPFQEGFYRTLVAEDPVNVNNTQCNSISNVFQLIQEDPVLPISLGDQTICEGQTATLAVVEESSVTVDWYDAEEGGNLLLEDSFTYQTDQPGTYYAESVSESGNCVSEQRIAVRLSINEIPDIEDQELVKCSDQIITLTAGASVAEYEWNTGDTTQEIEVSDNGEYILNLTTEDGCTATQTFTVSSYTSPQIQDVISNDNDIEIIMQNSGDFSYSLDGANFQNSPVFENVEGGLYNIVVLENNDCGSDAANHLHLIIPEFFTPNQDGVNDRLIIKDVHLDGEFTFHLFDRYGKIIFSARNQPFAWDGTFQGKPLPSSDYWYKLKIDNKLFTGNITLKR